MIELYCLHPSLKFVNHIPAIHDISCKPNISEIISKVHVLAVRYHSINNTLLIYVLQRTLDE